MGALVGERVGKVHEAQNNWATRGEERERQRERSLCVWRIVRLFNSSYAI